MTADYKLRPIFPISEDRMELVSDLICLVTRSWNLAVLEQQMLPMDLEVAK